MKICFILESYDEIMVHCNLEYFCNTLVSVFELKYLFSYIRLLMNAVEKIIFQYLQSGRVKRGKNYYFK